LCDTRTVDLTRRCKPLVFAFYHHYHGLQTSWYVVSALFPKVVCCFPPVIGGGGVLSDAIKIGTEVAPRDSDTTFKVKGQRSKVTRPLYSPPCWRGRRLQRQAWERVGRGKLLLRTFPSARPREALRRPTIKQYNQVYYYISSTLQARFHRGKRVSPGKRGASAYRGGRPPTAS